MHFGQNTKSEQLRGIKGGVGKAGKGANFYRKKSDVLLTKAQCMAGKK